LTQPTPLMTHISPILPITVGIDEDTLCTEANNNI
jgi:hypothetical protein